MALIFKWATKPETVIRAPFTVCNIAAAPNSQRLWVALTPNSLLAVTRAGSRLFLAPPRIPPLRTDSTRTEFRGVNFGRDLARDQRIERSAPALGWKTMTIWACDTRATADLTRRLILFDEPIRLR